MGVEYVNNGADPQGADVAATGTMLLARRTGRKLACITNAGTKPIYLALRDSVDGVCPAVVGSGIYLSANGGAYEINLENLYLGEVWAIHADVGATHRACIQEGA